MSRTEHTPGPWRFWDRGEDYTNSLITDASGASGIAHLIGRIRGNDVTIPEMRANARLIAAAPELLEALREMRCWIGNGKPAAKMGATCETLSGALDLADAAIAKAEGAK